MSTQARLGLEVGDDAELKDTKFMSADEKRRVLRAWDKFLKGNLSRDCFSHTLYHHLVQHCEFIAHFDINGFYATYFEEPENAIKFLSQFDDRNGPPMSIEYGMEYWYTDSEYNDVNAAMCLIARKYIPSLIKKCQAEQKEMDITRAKLLLTKHGLKVSIEG